MASIAPTTALDILLLGIPSSSLVSPPPPPPPVAAVAVATATATAGTVVVAGSHIIDQSVRDHIVACVKRKAPQFFAWYIEEDAIEVNRRAIYAHELRLKEDVINYNRISDLLRLRITITEQVIRQYQRLDSEIDSIESKCCSGSSGSGGILVTPPDSASVRAQQMLLAEFNNELMKRTLAQSQKTSPSSLLSGLSDANRKLLVREQKNAELYGMIPVYEFESVKHCLPTIDRIITQPFRNASEVLVIKMAHTVINHMREMCRTL